MLLNKKRNKRANELDGKTWLSYSVSVWNIVKTKEEREFGHPAVFPVEIAKRIIEIFTTGDRNVVLDPFMGVGTTLVAACELGKKGIGFEISKEYVKIADKRLRNSGCCNYVIYNEDVRKIDLYLKEESVDLCVTSPPYWNVLSGKRTADCKSVRDYCSKKGNLGEICDYDVFLEELGKIFTKVYKVLRKRSYCVVIVMDLRKKSVFYPFHMDVAGFMRKIGFVLDDIIIWDRRREYNNLKPLGYPFVFRVNKVHEYVMIFRKENPK